MSDNRKQVRLRPIIRVFVSSTFSDMKHERNALAADVFPKLEQLCQNHGFQFQALDLRWGVSTEAGLDHRTMRICFDELRRAQEISPRPNLLILLGNRYGWRPLPEEISVEEFHTLEHAAAQIPGSVDKSTVAVLREWYRADTNAVPPVYLLQSRRQDLGDDQDYTHDAVWNEVQAVLWAIINLAMPPEQLQRRFDVAASDGSPPAIVRFQASATEQEIWRGALRVPDAPEHVLAFFREIENLAAFSDPKQIKDFVDVDPSGSVEVALRTEEDRLKAELRQRLGSANVLRNEAPVRFVEVQDHHGDRTVDVTTGHLARLCADVVSRLSEIIQGQIEKYWRNTVQASTDRAARELEIEQREHQRFSKERGGEESFVGRQVELQAILDYVGSDSRWPLVIHGASGCGKTALLAHASQEVAKTRKRIERFIGVAPRSSDVRSLLSSLCQELRQRNPLADALPAEIKGLRDEFSQHLHSATPEQPLVLFLDALDQLADADNGRLPNWLPPGSLPAHVKLIASCLSDRATGDSAGRPYAELKRRQIPAENFINLDALSEDETRLLLFDRWLPKAGRKVGDDQRASLEQRLASPACRQPIYLKLLFEEVQLWHSYDPAPAPRESVPELLGQLFDRLCRPTNHGPLLVNRVLGYLSASRHGLAENEILEILFADPEYRTKLNEATEQTQHDLPPDAKRIPTALWSRLRFELAPYLTERAAPGANVLTFYHRQVAEWVQEQFAATPDQSWQPHKRLADYFRSLADPEKNQSWRGDSPRPFLQLAFHLARADANELSAILFDFSWLLAKTGKTPVFDLIDDYDEALRALPANHPQRHALALVQSSLRLSSREISSDRARLANRLLGRLLGDRSTDVARLLDATVRVGGGGEPWLRPLKRCLPLAPGALVAADESHHIDSLRGLALTPDGTKLISWDCDAVCVRSSDELRFLRKTRAPGRNTIEALAPLPDGRRLAYAMNEERPNIYLWDFDNDSTTELAMNRERIRSLAAAGDLLVAAGGDEPPIVWSLSQGKKSGQLDCPAEADDGAAEPAAAPGTYRLAEPPVKREPVRIHAVAASPDGAAFVGVARAERQSWLLRWSLPDCRLAYAQPIALPSFSNWLSIQVTHDSRYCIVSGSNNVLLFEAVSGEAFRMLTGHATEVNSFALAGDWVYAVANWDTLKVWELATSECLTTIRGTGISQVAAMPNGRLVVVRDRFHLQLWEKHTLELATQPGADFSAPVSAVTMDRNWTAFLAAAEGQSPVLWRDGTLLNIPVDASVRHLAVSADNQYLFVATTDSLVMWSVRERRVVGNLGDIGQVVSFLNVADNGNLLVGYSNGAFGVWHIGNDGRTSLTAKGQVPAAVSSISPDGRYVTCLGESCTLHFHDVIAPNQPVKLYTGSTYRDINSVAISGDGQRLAIAAGSWRLQGHCKVIIARIRPSGAEPTTLISEFEFGEYSNPTSTVTGMAFSHNGQSLALCDEDGELFWFLSEMYAT